MMVEMIDAHHHLWHYTAEEYGWISPGMKVLRRDFLAEDLAAEMHASGVAGSVVVQARQTLEETEWLLGIAGRAPHILGVVGWAPVAGDGFADVLRSLSTESKLKGLRHVVQDEPDDNFILREDFNRGIDRLLDTGLVYDILIHERHLPQAAIFAGRHPQQIFVLDHLAKPLVRDKAMQPWKDNLHRLAQHQNVYCKLSGLVTEAGWNAWTLEELAPYLDAALEAFGPARLMAGSDWPVCLLASSYARWWQALHKWSASLGEAACAQIFSATARSVYQLELPPPA
jgi:L-fuconolactonase